MSSIRFKPLYGTWGDQPVCYLLEIDSCRILLDCGWDDCFNLEMLTPLKEEVEKGIDAVLISHPDLQHLGALPYAVGKLGMKSKIYATIPVKNMGQMFLYDVHVSLTSTQDFDVFALDDVDLAFHEDTLVPLKYSQRASIATSSGSEIEIIPYAAGHMIGGTFWKIRKETEEIIYAVDFNHKKENLLKPAELENFSRPSLLITGTSNIDAETDKRHERDSKLSSLIMETISQNGNVLIPIDTAGRVLEILMILDQIWAKRGLSNVGLVFLNNFSDQTIEFAKISVEWMSDLVMKRFNMDREKPFSFEYVKECQTMEQVAELKPPYVVLASSPTLECGFSRDLFVQFASERRNLILFTSKQRKRCLASDLMENAQLGTQFYELEIKQKIALEGDELEEYKLNLERKKEEKDRELQNQNLDEIDFIGDIEEDEPEALIPLQPNPYFETSFDLIVGRDTKSITAHPMFPFVDEHLDWDEYGEQVIVEDFKPSSDDPSDLSALKEAMETEEAVEMQVPKKSIVRVENVTVNCKIEYLNYEGKSDARSIKNILSKMAPRKIILVNGEETCNTMLKFCSEELKTICNYVAAPQIGEVVDVTSDTAILNVKLSDSLMNSLRFDKMKGYDIAYFNSIVKYAQNDEDSMEVEEQDNLARLESIPEEEAPGHDAVFVGDLLLSEFKKALTNIGYHVELASGVLVCNGVITLQKVGDFPGRARVNIEGPMCDEYYVIRDLLYQQFCIY